MSRKSDEILLIMLIKKTSASDLSRTPHLQCSNMTSKEWDFVLMSLPGTHNYLSSLLSKYPPKYKLCALTFKNNSRK